jgi:hypothetical protein
LLILKTGEDAEEEDIANPFASDLEEGMDSHEFKDPKKTLRGYFEREGTWTQIYYTHAVLIS